MTIEAKRNCGRVTNRGEEAWSESMGRRTGIGSEAQPSQDERARDREVLMIKAEWRKSGGRVEKDGVLTWGALASCLKGQRSDWSPPRAEREVSRGHSRSVERRS